MLRRDSIRPICCGLACLLMTWAGIRGLHGAAAELQEEIRVVRSVGAGGKGNVEASKAWKHLAAASVEQLPVLLGAMDGANDFAVNWIRSAVDAVAERALREGKTLPESALGTFVLDTTHHAEARRAAYLWISKVDNAAAVKLLPGFLNDPGVDLRRMAVEQVMASAKVLLDGGNRAGASLLYQQALSYTREAEQLDAIAVSLRELGVSVDLVKQFGFITGWKVAGPFDNTGGAGFAKVYPPEVKVDLAARYEGKGTNVTWTSYQSTNDHGFVDINSVYGKIKEVVGYATTEFYTDSPRQAELRIGSQNGWKVWLNGKFLFGRDEYHRGVEVDQYRMPVMLNAGRNELLVKVCQNEQKEEWTEEWRFQLRITDSLGTPLISTSPTPSGSGNGQIQGQKKTMNQGGKPL